jgi:hypothetical protein
MQLIMQQMPEKLTGKQTVDILQNCPSSAVSKTFLQGSQHAVTPNALLPHLFTFCTTHLALDVLALFGISI